jgi:predicted nucleic acid-binding protein
MIVVDSSVWIDHHHHGIAGLAELLEAGAALMHPFVLGEIALGSLRNPAAFLGPARQLPQPPIAEADEVLNLIGNAGLAGSGIGYVDTHLLASAMLVPAGALWTHDKRLLAVATRLGLHFD